MYAGVGADPLVFLPGAITTRQRPPDIKELPTRPPPTIKEIAPESTPKSLPTVVPVSESEPEKSNLPLYIALGGIAAIGIGFFVFRK